MQSFVLPKSLRRDGIVQRLANALLALPLERAWCVEIREHKGIRSIQQNRYLWGCVYPTILQAGAEQLAGWDSEDLHDYFLGEHFGWETLTGFGRRRIRPVRRSSRLSKDEFAQFIGFIQRKAAEIGIFVPDADPDWWERAA